MYTAAVSHLARRGLEVMTDRTDEPVEVPKYAILTLAFTAALCMLFLFSVPSPPSPPSL